MNAIRDLDDVLKLVYSENDFPSERLIRDQAALEGLTQEFNSRVRGRFEEVEVAAEIERIRKDKKGTGGLPRLGRSFSGPHFLNNPK